MTLPNSGFISLNDVQTEFGGTNPIFINEYYGADTGIPESGAITLADFYGATAYNGPTSVDYQMIGGGGGGAGGLGEVLTGTACGGGGGGAGGYVTGTQSISSGTSYTITIGAGGAANATNSQGVTGYNGGNTVFHTTTANGGGGGGGGNTDWNVSYGTPGAYGGCGGGGGGGEPTGQGGIGNQGYNGGRAFNDWGGDGVGGGGGGTGGNGQNGGNGGGGSGGTGNQFIDGVWRGGGGAGGASELNWEDWFSLGRGVGVHGGGDGSWRNAPPLIQAPGWVAATPGTTNTGGGGGGGQWFPDAHPAAGGSGICIIYWPDSYDRASATTGSPTYSNSGGNHIYTFTGSGTITF